MRYDHPETVVAIRIVLVASAIAFLSYLLVPHAFVSSEVDFADQSRSGLFLVPASGGSCDSSPSANRDTACPGDMCFNLEGTQGGPPGGYFLHETFGVYRLCCPNGFSYDTYSCYPPGGGTGSGTGTGTGSPSGCVPSYYCTGNTLNYVNNACGTSVVQTCGYQCAGGACVVPPPPTFVPTPSTPPGGGTFMSTGHLQARPTLVRSGDTVQLYWTLSHVQNCTVTGTNGDSFTGASSGAAGRTSGAIVSRTTFTLNCTALPTATPASVTESIIVNVAPIFNEN